VHGQLADTCLRFAEFELDLSTGELRRNGALLKLQPQPARILTILVSRVPEVRIPETS
jgi:DNA-binding winged helix-turn-helix (wHTH) protein